MTDQQTKLPAPEKVLIVKPSALGDVVSAIPVLRGLRRTFGRDIRVDWLVSKSCAPLILHDSDIDRCVIFDRETLGRAWYSPVAMCKLKAFLRQLKRARYDWVIDLQGLFRSGWFTRTTKASMRAGFSRAKEGAGLFYNRRVEVDSEMHTVDRNIVLARDLGIDARSQDMTLQISDSGASFAKEFIASNNLSGGFVICVPPTRWVTKMYPVRHWRKVVAALTKHLPVVLIGTPADRKLCQSVADGLGEGVFNSAGQTNVEQMVAMIAACRGVICCDSAAQFIAPAVGVDVVTLIGPTRVKRTGPYLRGRAIVSPVPCQGCLKRYCRHITCMEWIAPDDVISAAEEMMDK